MTAWTPAPALGGGRRGGGRSHRALPVLGGLLALYLLVPIGVFLWHLGSGAEGLRAPGLGSALAVSALAATISTAIIALLGIPLAWTLARLRGWPSEVLTILVALPLALPPLMSGILLIDVVGPYTWLGRMFNGGLTDSLTGIVLAQVFVAAPFLILAARSAFASIDPALLDVAATLGHGGWSRFYRVSLPLAAPGIQAGLVLSWLRAFGEFGATVILAYHPYSLPVFTFVQFSSTGVPSTEPPTGAALGAAAVVLVLARLLLVRRWVPAGRWGRPGTSAPPPPGHDGAAAVSAAPPQRPRALCFDLRTRAGDFGLAVAHQADAPHLALLGPSGAGKSLSLRCLAGLRGTGTGTVTLGNEELGDVPAERRAVGWVPQDAGLFPHLDVWQQLTFGTRATPEAAAAWLARLELTQLARRRPAELSGGQRQRVALGRALATDPDLLLLDEPFSALDRPVREEMRRLLRGLQRELGVPTVIVTHDPEEAALLSEEIVVLADGRVLQAGPGASVFGRPASRRVAELLAIDNLREGRLLSSGRLIADGTELDVHDGGLATPTRVSWCVRAEDVEVRKGPGEGAGRPATVVDILHFGTHREVAVRLDGGLDLVARSGHDSLQLGDRCVVAVPPRSISLWPSSDAPPG